MTHSPSLFAQSKHFAFFLIATTTILPGCHRQYYRKQADGEVHALIAQKASHVSRPPNVPIHIDVDRRSRMYNPFDLDFQPMPLDDPSSYQYMQCVDGRRGYPMWEAAGLTNASENPDWWQFLPLDDDGVLVLNSENAVRIALLHSPDYQRQVEQLYLAALSVSAERFVFDTQFFGGAEAFLTADGPRRNGGSDSSTRLQIGPQSNGSRDLALQRRFATGGQLIAGVANSIVWELSGPNAQSASTVLDFSLVQPLLRNAGRDKVMEGLTQSERSLLAAVRTFERFRRNFFLNVTIGRPIESTVQLNSAVPSISGSIGFNAGGFLRLLQNQLEIRNQEENITRLEEDLVITEDQLIESLTTIPEDPGSIISQRLQVAQRRQTLVTNQQRLVNQQASYQASVDAFLRTLGLPPYICVRLDDPFLDRFELIDRVLLERRKQITSIRSRMGSINVSILDGSEYKQDVDTGLPVATMQWTPTLTEQLSALRRELEPLGELVDDIITNDVPVIEEDITNLAEAIPKRRAQSESLRELYERERDSICGLLQLSQIEDSVFDVETVSTLSEDLKTEFETVLKRFDSYKQQFEELQNAFDVLSSEQSGAMDPRELAARLRSEIILGSQDLVAELGDDVLQLQLIQARARTESVVLPEIDVDPQTALEIARKNRRDWANARASLVDSWRAIEVSADDLESTLDVVFSGDVQNVGNNPLSLRNNTGQLRVGLQWDAPITRLQERNAYRTTLIRYEQSKRAYYGFEDSVWQRLRGEIRQLQVNRFTFELGRELVRNSAAQIGLTTDQRELREARGGQQTINASAARDQIQALNALLTAQNNLLGIFVNYEVVRRGLDFDLGTMELSPEGLWLDPGEWSPESLMSLPGTTVEGMLECGCNDCGLVYHPLPDEPRFSDGIVQPAYVETIISEGVDMSMAIGVSEGVIQELPVPQEHAMPVEDLIPSERLVPMQQAVPGQNLGAPPTYQGGYTPN